MEPTQGNGQPNMNTIYEELDLGDRVKKLKGKTVKVKRLVRKEDGSMTLKDSTLNGTDQSIDVSIDGTVSKVEGDQSIVSQIIEQKTILTESSVLPENKDVFRKPRKEEERTAATPSENPLRQSNPMFMSTFRSGFQERFGPRASTATLKTFDPNSKPPTSIIGQPQAQTEPLTRAVDRAKGSMYSSMTFTKTANGIVRAALTEETIFRLPNNVNEFLNQEETLRQQVGEATNREKLEAAARFSVLREVLLEEFSKAEEKVFKYYDDFQASFSSNMEAFKQKCNAYKADGWVAKSGVGPQVRVTGFDFATQKGELLRQDPADLKLDAADINKEVNRRLLSFLAETLNKRVLHAPLFAHTPSTQEYLEEIISGCRADVARRLEGVQELVYQTSHPDVSDVKARCHHEPWVPRASLIPTERSSITSRSTLIERRSITRSELANKPAAEIGDSILSQVNVSQPPSTQTSAQSNINTSEIIPPPAQTSVKVETRTEVSTPAKPAPEDPSPELSLPLFIDDHMGFLNNVEQLTVSVESQELIPSEASNDILRGILPLNKNFSFLYGSNFHGLYDAGNKTLHRLNIPNKIVSCAEIISTRPSRLNVDKLAFLNKNEHLTSYLLLAAINMETGEGEVVVGSMTSAGFIALKTISALSDSPIRFIFPLADGYCFLGVTEASELILFDLSLLKAKSIVTKLKDQVTAAAILGDKHTIVFAISEPSLQLYDVTYSANPLRPDELAVNGILMSKIIPLQSQVTQVVANGERNFDFSDKKGDITSVTLAQTAQGNKTSLQRVNLCSKGVDRFFRVQKSPDPSVQTCLAFVSLEGVFGIYHRDSKLLKLFDLDHGVAEHLSDTTQNICVVDNSPSRLEVLLLSNKHIYRLLVNKKTH